MDQYHIYLKLLLFLLMLAAPFIYGLERKRIYGKAERRHQLFLDRSRPEIKARLKRSRAELAAVSEQSIAPTPITYFPEQPAAADSRRLLLACHYPESLLLRQLLPFFLGAGILLSSPFILALLLQKTKPEMALDTYSFICCLWLVLAIAFFYLLRKGKKSRCLIYNDALLFLHHPLFSHIIAIDYPQLLIPLRALRWIGLYSPDVNRKIYHANIPVIKLFPLPYLPMYLEKWVLVYAEGGCQYGLIFYPSEAMIQAFRQQLADKLGCPIETVLQTQKIR